MGDKTTKNLFDDGYTTYHDDGSVSKTYKNLLDDGYTTHHDDGSTSKTYKNLFDDGHTTYHDDGSTSKTYQNLFDDDYTTYHDDGSVSRTHKNILSDGYTTYHDKGSKNAYENMTESDLYLTGIKTNTNFSYLSTYLRHKKIDFSVAFATIIGVIISSWLCWLYAGEGAFLPTLIFDCVLLACMIGTHLKKGYPYLWAWMYYIFATGMVMIMVNNRSFVSSSILSLLIWLAPLGVSVIIGFVANFLGYEDRFEFPALSYILIAITWFCTIYKNYPFIYNYCILGEKIAFLVFALLSLLLAVHDAKAQKKTEDFWAKKN